MFQKIENFNPNLHLLHNTKTNNVNLVIENQEQILLTNFNLYKIEPTAYKTADTLNRFIVIGGGNFNNSYHSILREISGETYIVDFNSFESNFEKIINPTSNEIWSFTGELISIKLIDFKERIKCYISGGTKSRGVNISQQLQFDKFEIIDFLKLNGDYVRTTAWKIESIHIVQK